MDGAKGHMVLWCGRRLCWTRRPSASEGRRPCAYARVQAEKELKEEKKRKKEEEAAAAARAAEEAAAAKKKKAKKAKKAKKGKKAANEDL